MLRSTTQLPHSQCAYCTIIGLFKPNSSRNFAFVSGVAPPSEVSVLTMSPGSTRSMKNTSVPDRNTVGIMSIKRRIMYFHISYAFAAGQS